MWKAMSEKEKAPYTKMNELDQVRYKKQLDELNDKGYFIMADGTKSSEMEIKKKKAKRSGKTNEKTQKKKRAEKVSK